MNTQSPMDIALSSGELFPAPIKLLRLEHAHRMLTYILRRPDNDFTADNIEPLLRGCRRVRAEYVAQFYQNLSGLVQSIERYISLEESCTMSGAYRKDLDLARIRVGAILERFEKEEDLKTVRYLKGMLQS